MHPALGALFSLIDFGQCSLRFIIVLGGGGNSPLEGEDAAAQGCRNADGTLILQGAQNHPLWL